MTTTTTEDMKKKVADVHQEAIGADSTEPQILEPMAKNCVIAKSPFVIRWTAGHARVVKWWLSVGHEPGLDDYFGDEYGPKDDLVQEVKVPMTGGDVFIKLEYQLDTGSERPSYGELPIIECATKDCTKKPCHERPKGDESEESEESDH